MKKVMIIAAIATMGISCNKEKCIQCTERYTQIKGEYCGNKSQREDFERGLKLNQDVLRQRWKCETIVIR